MINQGEEKENELCIPEEEAIDLVGLTTGLMKNMTDQMKRLKEEGYNTSKIEKQIRLMKKRVRVARRLVKE